MKTEVKRAPRLGFDRPMPTTLDQHIGNIQNVSQTGCMLKARKWIKIDRAQHQLNILPPGDRPITVVGHIVRANMVPLGDGIVYEIGIKFDREDPTYQRFQEWFDKLMSAMSDEFNAYY